MSSNSSMMVTENVSRVGLGYGIAIAVGILVLVSTIMLASYVCVRVQGRGQNGSAMTQGPNSATIVPQSSSVEEGMNISAEWSVGGGLDQNTINSYPKMVFSRQHQLPHSQDPSCSICLGDYKYQEILRLMPDCRHCFHASCIDAWLRLNPSCPVCRTSPLPTPIPTPLSELIPLARQSLPTR